MVFKKQLFLEVVTIDKREDLPDIIYRALHANIRESYIEIREISDSYLFKDVK